MFVHEKLILLFQKHTISRPPFFPHPNASSRQYMQTWSAPSYLKNCQAFTQQEADPIEMSQSPTFCISLDMFNTVSAIFLCNYNASLIKEALVVCFALKSWKEYLLLFTYFIILGKDATFPLITKFKTNKYLRYLFVNRIPN